MGEEAVEKAWFCGRALVQFIVMIPCLLWVVLSFYAIPVYSSIGWYAPVFCSIVGIFSCFFMLVSLWKRGRDLRELFKIHIHFDDWIDEDDETVTGPLQCVPQQVSRRALDYHKWELKIAIALTLFLYTWSAICWYVELNMLTPAETDAHLAGTKCGCIKSVNRECVEASPLGESCRPSDCPSDPNCRAWTSEMADKHSILMICPTVSPDADTTGTFSCHADAAWLSLTGTVALMYLLTLALRTVCLPSSRKKKQIQVAQAALGVPMGEDEAGLKA